jgi:copper(I)-binding protein
MRGLVLSAVALLLLALPARAADITVSDGWFRALPAKLPSGGYFSLHNGGARSVTLTGASSPACGMLMLHKSDAMNGMSGMSDVENVLVAAGDTVRFAPGGYHLMCTDPTLAMRAGATVPVTLEFVGGTKISADFAVKDAKGK